jgi:hypothetical protein
LETQKSTDHRDHLYIAEAEAFPMTDLLVHKPHKPQRHAAEHSGKSGV